jgi:cysteinyl-tRNA synthetase
MALSVFNTLTRTLEPFTPAQPDIVRVYACGPTVYNHVHVGNWFAFTFDDVLVRWLRDSGYNVTYVMNITDVDDKTIRDSQAAGESRAAFTERWTKVFFEGLEMLGFEPADHYPRATHHVEGREGALGMVEMIQVLLDKGHAYLAGDDSIYYRVSSFPTYGQLAGLDMETLQAGASGRVSVDEYEKDHVGDFALWKGYEPEDGDNFWTPSFTVDGAAREVKGRPGWHIECSVMSSALLGEQIDIHVGGEDLIFPHHQNEIAQSEACTGISPFVRYWMHNRHLLIDGSKMSKSKGTFYTLQDILDREGPDGARAFRYMCVAAHYRSQMDFSWKGLASARRTLANLDDAHARFAAAAGRATASRFADAAEKQFEAAMDNDLQTSEALGAVHGLVGAANRALEGGAITPEDAAAAVRLLERADRVLGLKLGATRAVTLTAEQQGLLDQRAQARADKDWGASDRLRDELQAHGLIVKDGPEGQTVSRL